MINKADGALSEAIGNVCKDFVENNPDQVIEFLSSDHEIVDKKFIDDWASQIADEFEIECEGKENECVQESFQKA